MSLNGFNSIEEYKKEIAKKYNNIFNEIAIGDTVYLENENLIDFLDEDSKWGEVIDKKYYKELGVSVRVDFNGYKTWVGCEDVGYSLNH